MGHPSASALVLALLLAGPSAAPAEDLDPADLPSGSFVLRGVRLERGDGTVVEDAVVVVRDGRIEAAGAAGETAAPAGLPVEDGGGGTVMAGLVLPISRLGLRPPEGSKERSTPGESVTEELNPFHTDYLFYPLGTDLSFHSNPKVCHS